MHALVKAHSPQGDRADREARVGAGAPSVSTDGERDCGEVPRDRHLVPSVVVASLRAEAGPTRTFTVERDGDIAASVIAVGCICNCKRGPA